MTDEVRLTAGDVCKIAGIPPNTLDRWVRAGLLDPTNFGRGHGVHRIYRLSDAVAVAAGVKYRAEGADPDRVAGVVRFLAGYGLDQLEEELAAGRTFPVPAAMIREATDGMVTWIPGMLIAPPLDCPEMSPRARALMRRLDLVAIVREVKRRVAELNRRPKRPRGGVVGKRQGPAKGKAAKR